jgi:hypothetical protein
LIKIQRKPSKNLNTYQLNINLIIHFCSVIKKDQNENNIVKKSQTQNEKNNSVVENEIKNQILFYFQENKKMLHHLSKLRLALISKEKEIDKLKISSSKQQNDLNINLENIETSYKKLQEENNSLMESKNQISILFQEEKKSLINSLNEKRIEEIKNLELQYQKEIDETKCQHLNLIDKYKKLKKESENCKKVESDNHELGLMVNRLNMKINLNEEKLKRLALCFNNEFDFNKILSQTR